MNILNKPEVTLEQCTEWAKSKKASELYMTLVPKLYGIALAYDIDPALVVAQCAKETGYCKFGGVLDASFKNTCGLKISKGGSCVDPDAHKRFDTWEDGITAQCEHLALYAGKEGYPLANPLDPRHFSYLHGKCKTVESLSGNWAGATYGQDLVKMMQEIKSIKVSTSNVDVQEYKDTIATLTAQRDELRTKLNQINTLSK